METAMTARAAQRSGDALSNPGASMPLTGWAGTEPHHPAPLARESSIHDMRRLREDREGVACPGERLDDAARQAVAPLDRLVGVGVGPHRDLLAGPPGRAQLGA